MRRSVFGHTIRNWDRDYRHWDVPLVAVIIGVLAFWIVVFATLKALFFAGGS